LRAAASAASGRRWRVATRGSLGSFAGSLIRFVRHTGYAVALCGIACTAQVRTRHFTAAACARHARSARTLCNGIPAYHTPTLLPPPFSCAALASVRTTRTAPWYCLLRVLIRYLHGTVGIITAWLLPGYNALPLLRHRGCHIATASLRTTCRACQLRLRTVAHFFNARTFI